MCMEHVPGEALAHNRKAWASGVGAVPDDRLPGPWGAEVATVVAHERGGPDWFTLRMAAPCIAASARPGQFAQVGVTPLPATGRGTHTYDPLLRRPLSFCTIDRGRGVLSLVYRVVGRGTAILAQAVPGQRLELLGPLGRPFPCLAPRPAHAASAANRDGALILVGGGLGIPPMAAAAAWALAAGRKAVAILGARTSSYLAGADAVAATGADVRYATEDGSRGHRGLITPLLAVALDAHPAAEVWACGPSGMLASVQRLCHARAVNAWLCVERPMACGFGVCLGCAIARADGAGFLKACVDGPVFRGDEIDVQG